MTHPHRILLIVKSDGVREPQGVKTTAQPTWSLSVYRPPLCQVALHLLTILYFEAEGKSTNENLGIANRFYDEILNWARRTPKLYSAACVALGIVSRRARSDGTNVTRRIPKEPCGVVTGLSRLMTCSNP